MPGFVRRMRSLPSIAFGVAAAALVASAGASFAAASIDTDALQKPWPKEYVREFEVGRYPVRWRQKVHKKEGLFAGVRFTAPGERQRVWALSNDYTGVGHMTPGVRAVRIIDQEPHHQVIEVELKVLWKLLTLRFEVEQDPPQAMRFRWRDERFGEYRGVCLLEEVPGVGGAASTTTRIELATWFQPVHPVPMRLLLGVERIAMLGAVKEFLKTCER